MILKMKRPRGYKMSDPTTWVADPTQMIPDPLGRQRPTAGNGEGSESSESGMTFNADIAASALAQAEMEPADTVTQLAPSGPTESGNASASEPSVDSASTKPNTTPTQCEHCAAEFTPKRPHGRFCSSYCRRLAWLGRNPEKAAELAERDRQRLREHVIGCGGEWRETSRI